MSSRQDRWMRKAVRPAFKCQVMPSRDATQAPRLITAKAPAFVFGPGARAVAGSTRAVP